MFSYPVQLPKEEIFLLNLVKVDCYLKSALFETYLHP